MFSFEQNLRWRVLGRSPPSLPSPLVRHPVAMSDSQLLVIGGASGVGKSSAALRLEAEAAVHRVDTEGCAPDEVARRIDALLDWER